MLLSICLIFCQFKPGVAYKNVAYKKSVSSQIVTESTYPKNLNILIG